MSQHDDEIRDAFREGRAEDRENAPSFGATWGAASQKTGRRRWMWGAVAAAAAAAAAAVVIIAWPKPVAPPEPTSIAETHPVPDIPTDDPESPQPAVEEAELVELAEWSPDDTLRGPTDFLLDSDGALGGGLPTSDLNDSVLSFERELDMEL